MEPKSTPWVAGFGGAAAVAAALVFGGGSGSTDAAKPTDRGVQEKTSSVATLTANQAGPWYAFCREYATDEFDHGDDPAEERGVKGHHVPQEAEDGTVEITRSIPQKGSSNQETEKFDVKKHTVGNLAGCVPAGVKLRVVIATVPDPDATQMPAEFDRDIEAIQAAATEENYSYTRFWMPWRASAANSQLTADPEAENNRRNEPGILCFRKNDASLGKATERLFVLLVGETPTSGVNRLQLAHAIYYRNEFFVNDQIADEDRSLLKIAGPHFSASLPPLQDVMEKAVYTETKIAPLDTKKPLKVVRTPRVVLVSPDASSPDFIKGFRRFCGERPTPCAMQTLSLDSNEVREAALNYLSSIGYDRSTVAELTEDESAFGGSETHPQLDGPQQPSAQYGLSLQFPRDLAPVRAASDAESRRVAESDSKYFGLPNGLLPTHLTVHDPVDSDTPPDFGQEQKPADVARALEDIVLQLRGHHMRAVVVVATNPLDRIYLLEYLHNQLPNLRAVTIDADELELNRPHFVDLAGTIQVTTLPVMAGMNNLRQPFNVTMSAMSGKPGSTPKLDWPPVSFLSSRQQGEFLAMEMLIDRRSLPAEAKDGNDARPCYSISVAGEDGFFLLPAGDASAPAQFPCPYRTSNPLPGFAAQHSGPNSGLPPSYALEVPNDYKSPGLFLPFLWAIGVFTLGHLFCLARSLNHRESLLSYPHRLGDPLEARRLYLLFVVNNQLWLLDCLGFRLIWAVRHASAVRLRNWVEFMYWFLAAMLVVLTLLMIHFVVRFIGLMKNCSRERRDLLAGMVLASVFLCWTALMIWQMPSLWAHPLPFLQRLTRVNSGLSPVMSITAIVAGYFLWGWFQLKRLDWIASRKIDLQLDKGGDKFFAHRVFEIMRATDSLSPPPAVVCGSLLVMPFTWLFLFDDLNGFDGLGFHVWFAVFGFPLLLLTVILAGLHAREIWQRLRTLLEWLETTPLEESFRTLGTSDQLNITIWDLAESERSFTILSRTVDSMKPLYGASSNQVSGAKQILDSFVKANAIGKQAPAGAIDRLNTKLNVGVPAALASLDIPECRNYVALRLMALIRYTMLQIRTLIVFVAYGYLAAVFSIMFYAFEGRQTLGDLAVMVFVILLLWIATMMFQFQGNAMLRLLAGSDPGKNSVLGVLPHLLAVGGVPLLAIVTAQFPSVGNFVLMIFKPVMKALQ